LKVHTINVRNQPIPIYRSQPLLITKEKHDLLTDQYSEKLQVI